MSAAEPNLVCPYTGETMVPVFQDNIKHEHGWYLKGGFDPSVMFLTEELALKALSRRRGKFGEVTRLVCPYTAKPLKVFYRRGHGLWEIRGGYFNPRAILPRKAELLYAVSVRNGRKPKFELEEYVPITITDDFSDQSDPTQGLGGNGDELEEGINLLLGD